MLASLEQLVDCFHRLPGVGAKSAMRLAFHILDMPDEQLNHFLGSIQEAKRAIHACPQCLALSDQDHCSYCNTPYTEEGILCVVEQSLDIFALEKHLAADTKFHCLGGKLSPLNGITPSKLNLENLMSRLKEPGLKEIILAMGADVEGEATAAYLREQLPKDRFHISRIAFGVSVGGSLSIADERSIQKSLAGRTTF